MTHARHMGCHCPHIGSTASWNPYVTRPGCCAGGLRAPVSCARDPECGCDGWPHQPNDFRYRSFHNFNHFHGHLQGVGKSRASWAVPSASSRHLLSRHYPISFGSSNPFLAAMPSEADLASHPDLVSHRRLQPTTSCACIQTVPSSGMVPGPPAGLYESRLLPCVSTYELAPEHSRHHGFAQRYHSGRLPMKKNQSSQTYDRHFNPNSKSLRWTKEQLKKFDNLLVKNHKSPLRNGSLSSSSGEATTDDSGIHSRSTAKSHIEQPESNRPTAFGRRPTRKLPTPPTKRPKSNRATVVKLKGEQIPQDLEPKQHRTLPPWPAKESKLDQAPKASVTQRLACFLRNVKLSKPAKKETVKGMPMFGRDLQELFDATQERVPRVLVACTEFIEKQGMVDGVYRISGVSSNIKRLRNMFEFYSEPDFLSKEEWIKQDIHCVPSLVKLFFRELPDPLCSKEVIPMLIKAASVGVNNSDSREALPYFKAAFGHLSKPQFWTLKHLMLHLQRLSEKFSETGMTSKNLAIVWTPNLFRTPLYLSHPALNLNDNLNYSPPTGHYHREFEIEHPRLQFNLVQNTQIVQYLIDNAKTIFNIDPHKHSLGHYFQVHAANSSQHKQLSFSKRYITSLSIEDFHSLQQSPAPVPSEANIIRLGSLKSPTNGLAANGDLNETMNHHQANSTAS